MAIKEMRQQEVASQDGRRMVGHGTQLLTSNLFVVPLNPAPIGELKDIETPKLDFIIGVFH